MITFYIVDDEDMIREGLQYYLDWSSYGAKVIGSQINGERAFPEILHLKPDVVLTDVVMPKMDGIELAKQLRLSGYSGEIIFLSAYQEIEYVKTALQLSASDFIFKPVQTNVMIDLIKKMVETVRKKEIQNSKLQAAEKALEDVKKLESEKLWSGLLLQKIKSETELSEITKGILREFTDTYYSFCVLLIHSHLFPNDVIKKQIDSWRSVLPCNVHFLYSMKENESTICEIIAFSKTEFSDVESDKKALSHILQQYNTHFKNSIIVIPGILVSSVFEIYTSYKSAHETLAIHFSHISDIHLSVKGLELDRHTNQWGKIIGEAVLSRNDESIESAILGLLKFMLDNGMNDINLIKANSVFVCLSMCDALFLSKEDEVFKDFNNDVIRIMDSHCIDDISFGLKNALKKLSRMLKDQSPRDKLIKSIRDIIEDNLDSIDILGISQKTNLSKNHLASEFKKATGETLNEYITFRRMEKAKELLKTSDLRIYEVANKVGYKDTAYFSKLFKRQVGCLPNQYKERQDVL